MSTQKEVRLPSTDEVNALGGAEHGIEHLAGTILLDRYRLVRLLGTGGAAVVYEAEHTIMHKAVAVKILRPELAQRQDYVQRFLAEARTVARLRHENIVDIVDVGRTETGFVFCVMEYLEGEELGTTLEREGRLPWPRARDLVKQVCRALAAAHSAGVVHRDVKPQNCFRVRHGTNEDFIKLLDFGISKQIDNDQGLTATGMIIGTAEYMSPEQARGRNVDARADIYAVGAMLFELLAGRPPFEGETFLDVLMKHASEPVPRISSLVEGLDPAVDDLLACALAKKPGDRFQSVQHFIVALNTIAEDKFVGLLDTRALRRLEARPESVLPRASGRHPAAPVARPWQTGAAVAVSVALFGLVLVLWNVLTDEEPAPAVVATAPMDAPGVGGGRPVERERSSEDGSEPATPLSPPPEPQPEPKLAPASVPAVSVLPVLPQTPSGAQTNEPPADVVDKPAPQPSRSRSSANTKPRADAKAQLRLKNRIDTKCHEDAREAVQPVVLDVVDGAFVFPPRFYLNLKDCIRKISAQDLADGHYRMDFSARKSPRTIEPFGDEG